MSDIQSTAPAGELTESRPALPTMFDVASARATITGAAAICTEIRDVCKKQNMLAVIGGKYTPTAVAYETAIASLGMTTTEITVTEQDDGTHEAVVAVVRLSDGQEVCRGSAICDPTEELWKDRPRFARRSMAVTRAKVRACRSVAGWVFKLAGYSDVAQEELDSTAGLVVESADTEEPGTTTQHKPVVLDATETSADGESMIGDHQRQAILTIIAQLEIDEETARGMVRRYGGERLADLSAFNGEKMLHELQVMRSEAEAPF